MGTCFPVKGRPPPPLWVSHFGTSSLRPPLSTPFWQALPIIGLYNPNDRVPLRCGWRPLELTDRLAMTAPLVESPPLPSCAPPPPPTVPLREGGQVLTLLPLVVIGLKEPSRRPLPYQFVLSKPAKISFGRVHSCSCSKVPWYGEKTRIPSVGFLFHRWSAAFAKTLTPTLNGMNRWRVHAPGKCHHMSGGGRHNCPPERLPGCTTGPRAGRRGRRLPRRRPPPRCPPRPPAPAPPSSGSSLPQPSRRRARSATGPVGASRAS